MTVYKNRHFKSESIILDGNSYTNCRFERCSITFAATSPFSLADNEFVNCAWTLSGAAELTLKFLTALYSGGGAELVERTFDNIRSGQHPRAERRAEDTD